METWYKQQSYFCAYRMENINAWINQEVIDIYNYTKLSLSFKPA